MATGLEVISGALKLLGVRAAESPLEPNEAQDGLVALNDMMAEWEERGIYTGFVPLPDVDESLIVPASAVGAIKAKLALYIAPEYNKEPSIGLEIRARRAFTALRASLVRVKPAEYPDSLPVGSGNENRWITTDGDRPNNTTDTTFYPPNRKRNF